MKHSRNRVMAAGMALALLLSAGAGRADAAGAPMPDFGPSVAFDKPEKGLRLAKLRGKAVLIIFFQSWCGICNGWSPDLIKQIETAHGESGKVVLIAIKTDGGKLAGAKDYLKSKKADMSKWIVASDGDARYYKQATGQNGLWKYVLVGADGNVAGAGQAGAFWQQAGGKKFVLGEENLLAKCGKAESFLSADEERPRGVSRVVRLAERGFFAKALKACSSVRGTTNRKAALELKKELVSLVKTKITAAADALKDEEKDWGERYEAHKTLGALLVNFRTTTTGREVRPLLLKMGRAPEIRKEKAAERSYLKVMIKLGEAGKNDTARLAREFKALAKKYEGTRYGEQASVIAGRIGGG